MKTAFVLAIGMILVSGCSTQASNKANNAYPGYTTAKTCISCHGENGMNGREDVPAIGQLSYDELKARVDNLKESNPGVPLIAHAITDEDLHQVSAYFAAVNKQN
ncbi:MAG TPA: hypothetical protein PLR90_08155 [Methylophilus sp.]|nr:hypothetical protein [Methylophilus sp.]HQQ33876.1 hypothetical protein [Methylophilus sp.]